QTIAGLKAGQITGWRDERLAAAAMLRHDPFFVESAARYLSAPALEVKVTLLARFRALREYRHYSDVLLVEMGGRVRLSLSGRTGIHTGASRALADALVSRKPVLTDLHTGEADSSPHISAIAPLFAAAGQPEKPIGAVILVSEARQFLFPHIQSWPTSSQTAETLLVRREGDSVLFLNDLRHQKDTALKLRIPLSRRDVPAVMAALGREGIVAGKDYRGVEVLSALKAVPDSPWFLVAQVDVAEALATWRSRSVLILSLLAGLAVLAVGTVFAFWQRNLKVHYRSLYESEASRRRTEERFRHVSSAISDIAYSCASRPDGGYSIDWMIGAVELVTGYSVDEIKARGCWSFLVVEEDLPLFEKHVIGLAPGASDSCELRWDRLKAAVEKAMDSGAGYQLELELIRLGGAIRWVNAFGGATKDKQGKIIGLYGTVQDITERKRAEVQLRYQAGLLANVNDAIIASDIQYRLTAWNVAAELLYGWKAEEVLGRNGLEIMRTEWPTVDADEMRRTIAETGSWRGEATQARKDGTRIPVEVSSMVLRDESGQIAGYASVNRNISERKKLEEELARHREHLEELVGKRTAEYKKLINLMTGREVRMADLKKAIGKLREQLKSRGIEPAADDPLKE
ncbi:MAG: PAS domain S-box protein, partial [Candidatus Aureabacteria bacterium]|nr:PAS domain S-box protein [Candidatus Auribacterota bacterium]